MLIYILGSVTGASNLDSYGSELLRNDDDLSHENIMLRLEGLSLTIPSDQMRMIQNINMLIAEVNSVGILKFFSCGFALVS